MEQVEISRATADEAAAAWAIVNEYYDAVQVIIREDEREFIDYYFGPRSGIWLAHGQERFQALPGGQHDQPVAGREQVTAGRRPVETGGPAGL